MIQPQQHVWMDEDRCTKWCVKCGAVKKWDTKIGGWSAATLNGDKQPFCEVKIA